MKDKETKSPEPEDVSLARAIQPEARADAGNGGGAAGGPNGPPFQVALTRPDSVLTLDHAFWERSVIARKRSRLIAILRSLIAFSAVIRT